MSWVPKRPPNTSRGTITVKALSFAAITWISIDVKLFGTSSSQIISSFNDPISTFPTSTILLSSRHLDTKKGQLNAKKNSPSKHLYNLETLPVDNGWTRLVVLALGNPHLIQHVSSISVFFHFTTDMSRTKKPRKER